MEKSYIKWIITFLSMTIFFSIIILTVNYTVDPLWNFKHKNSFNQNQVGFDERQQKTNLITHQNSEYDALILGNSIVTFMNQNDLPDMNAFNYAVSGMEVQEYNDYIEYAKKQNGKDFDYIILGLTFGLQAADENRFISNYESPESYFLNANKPFARYTSLFSIDTMKNALTNAGISLFPSINVDAYYTRDNVKGQAMGSEQYKQLYLSRQLDIFGEEWKDKTKVVVSNKIIYEELIANNPDTQFIVFTTPSLYPILDLMEETGRVDDYHVWLEDIIQTFGEVYDFNYPNTITRDSNNYYDGLHATPETMKLIASAITHQEEADIPDDFGILLTSENLNKHIAYTNQLFDLHAGNSK